MSYCEKMKRPCTCGRFASLERSGGAPNWDSGTGCLTDSEVRVALNTLLREWQRRFRAVEGELSQPRAQMR